MLPSTKAAAPEGCSATASPLPREALVPNALCWITTALHAMPPLSPTQGTEGETSPVFAYSPHPLSNQKRPELQNLRYRQVPTLYAANGVTEVTVGA